MPILGAPSLAASAASSARPGGFDPASTLGWSVPLLLLAPLVALVVVLTGVRGRRAASNLSLLTALVLLGAALLISWARFRQTAPYRIAYQWINVPVSFTGDSRFQGFGVDLAVKLDRYTLAALVAVAILFCACLLSHRVAAAREPGQIRYHVNVLLLLLCAVGVLVSSDLAELLAFWTVAGIASYLLLTHRWGQMAAARASRVALALPFLGDMALLSSVGLLYSRFALLDLDKLLPVLRTTPGVGLKSLTVAALLVFGAVFVRACLWPFTPWLTGAVGAPASVLALVAGLWPLLAGSLLLRTLPLVGAAGVQAPRAAGFALAAAALAGTLLGLIGTELRRSLLLASSGAVALALLGVLFPTAGAAGFTALLGVGLGRAGALLAGSAAAAAMRTVDLRQMGGGLRLMRYTTVALLGSVVAVSVAPAAATAWRPLSTVWLVLAPGLLLVATAGFRTGFAIGLGPLRRRRAFEPGRVREAPAMLAASALGCAAVGLAAAVFGFLAPWIGFLASGRHDYPAVGTYVLALTPVLAGLLLAAAAVAAGKDRTLALAALVGQRVGDAWAVAGLLYQRFLSRPALQIVGGVEGVALPAAESGLGRAAAAAGGLAGRSLPWLAVVAVAAVVLAVAFGLASPGVRR